MAKVLQIPPLILGIVTILACREAPPIAPTASTRLLAAVSGNQCESHEPELIGDPLLGDSVYSDYGRARYRIRLRAVGRSEVKILYYLEHPLQHPWGFFSDKEGCCPSPLPAYYDTDGDLVADGSSCIPNGEYTIQFERVYRSPDGTEVSADTLFVRSIAMLDTLGSREDHPLGGVFQDVHVGFALSTYADTFRTLAGSLRAADFFHDFSYYPDTALFSPPGSAFTIGVGDTLWFTSTYRAMGLCGWCGDPARVLSSFSQDYCSTMKTFGSATNSVPQTSDVLPMLHTFPVPRPSEPYCAAVRVTEPLHDGRNHPGSVQPDTIFVSVAGLDAAFTVTGSPVVGQPLTFDGRASQGYGSLEYRWTFGDTSRSWSASDSVVQHTYTLAGTFTVVLWVRRQGSTAPTDSASQQLAVSASQLSALVEGADYITSSGTYQWQTLASGGVSPYHYQWYYKQGVQAEEAVGTDSPWYSRLVTVLKTAYAFRLRSVVTDAALDTAQKVYWVDVVPGGGGALASVGLKDAAGACVALPAGREARQAAHAAMVALGLWPVPCRRSQ